MSKDYTKKNPLATLTGLSQEPIEKSLQVVGTAIKRPVGRPKVKTEEETIINIAIPVSIYEQINVAKACYGGNLTKYINVIILRDLNENYPKYKTINITLNGFKCL